MSKYTINGYKSIKGTDGDAFNVNLLRDGKKVAEVMYDGRGGDWDWDWCDRTKPRIEFERLNGAGDRVMFLGTHEEACLYAAIEGKTYTPPWSDEALQITPDDFIDDLINEDREHREMLKWCKTKTVFRLKTDPTDTGSWSTIAAPYSPRVKEQMLKRYGDNIAVIMNEVLADELAAKKGKK